MGFLPFLSVLAVIAPTPSAPTQQPPNPTVEAKQIECKKSPEVANEVRLPSPFTGKITKNRVRVRLKPNLDAPVLKEYSQNDCVVVVGAVDDFWAIQPQPNMKGYVFRSYILDNEVIGNHVNVRLEADTISPIIAQLNSGQKVTGQAAVKNNKWLEIALPENVHFYVAKEFVTNIGSKDVYTSLEARKKLLVERLVTIDQEVQNELKKPLEAIELAPFAGELSQIIENNKEFPQIVERAAELLQKMREALFEKNVMEKEPKAQAAVNGQGQQIAADINEAKETETPSESQKAEEIVFSPPQPFLEIEKNLVANAIETKEVQNADEFYQAENNESSTISGILRPYTRQVKNAPGDYILIDIKTGQPQCFLYSTKVNLAQYSEKEVTCTVTERPNNNFAWPAYFVLKVQ